MSIARGRSRALTIGLAAIVCVTLAAGQLGGARAEAPAGEAFERTWARTDKPVADGAVSRTWMWGPEAFTGGVWERYDESPDGQRLVQYFDKSRMEITHPDGDQSSVWYVTNGLLVVELVTGRMQVGDATFEDRSPADIPVAGDPDDVTGPTYAGMANALYAPAYADGQTITLRIDRGGQITDDPSLAGHGVTAAYLVQLDGLDHQVASPFWTFMNSDALVHEGGQNVVGKLFENPFYATGYPISEAFWASVKVGGVTRDVLAQCFERRCLTYTPGNPEGWQVEAGNVGRHYYAWRNSEPAVDPTPTVAPATETAASTETAVVSPTATATATRTPTPTKTPTDETPTSKVTPTATPTDYTTSENGRASVTPWSGHWWPFQESALPNLYDSGKALDKYDQYVKATLGYDPGARDWELDNHYGGLAWWGHCQAWAAASVSEPEPHPVTKAGISFTQDEVEGLLSETYFSPRATMWGKQCRDCATTSSQYKDITPAEFDAVIRERMGEDKENVIMDIDPGNEVWNYPAYKYARDSVVQNGVETVTMMVTVATPKVNVTGTRSDNIIYTYVLEPGTDGEWTGHSVNDHPDFIWVVTGRVASANDGNPNVRHDIVKDIAQ